MATDHPVKQCSERTSLDTIFQMNQSWSLKVRFIDQPPTDPAFFEAGAATVQPRHAAQRSELIQFESEIDPSFYSTPRLIEVINLNPTYIQD